MNSIVVITVLAVQASYGCNPFNDKHVDIKPREAVRRIGDQLSVLCKVPYPIGSCRMVVGTTSYKMIPNNTLGDIVYAGQGFEKGECGALIMNIKEEWNGNITCRFSRLSHEFSETMRLLVARAPRDPVLFSPKQQTFKDGDKFMAQCVVPNGRPVAKISWFLGSEEILTGKHQSVVLSEPGSDLQTISQNFSKTLTDEDDTKVLMCRAQHMALVQPKEARKQLIVQYPPKRQTSGTITIFGQKLGTEGRFNVLVRANPKPTAEWTLGEQVLLAPWRSDSGKFTAVEPLLLGSGYYKITLIVAHISREDVDRTYYLRVDNGLGREEFAMRISTIDKPVESNTTTLWIIIAIISSIFGTLLIQVVIMVIWKRCLIRRNPSQLPTSTHTEPFYLNMLFKKELAKEIEEIDQHCYEEIHPNVSEGET